MMLKSRKSRIVGKEPRVGGGGENKECVTIEWHTYGKERTENLSKGEIVSSSVTCFVFSTIPHRRMRVVLSSFTREKTSQYWSEKKNDKEKTSAR